MITLTQPSFLLHLLLFLCPSALADSYSGIPQYSSADSHTGIPQYSSADSHTGIPQFSDHNSDNADFISIIATAPPLTSFAGAATNYRATSHEFLASHNTARAAVGERPFVWDRQLARFAKRWSDQLGAECRIQHSMGPYGENLFWGSGWTWTAADAVKEWAQEQLYYNVIDNSCAPDQLCGHYTQIIWNSTLRIGCGRSECYNGGGVIIACSYDPLLGSQELRMSSKPEDLHREPRII